MNFENLWKFFENKNKLLKITKDDDNITLKKVNFKKAIQLAHEEGMKHQSKIDYEWETGNIGKEPKCDSYPSIFEQIFEKV